MQLLQFGPFEVDRQIGQLRKNGVPVRLQEQPFQLLVLLAERSGELVTRDEIRERLWSTDTYVVFEHSLNMAVNRLRSALNDSASSPRYIETVPRRGYRLISPVREGSSPETAAAPDRRLRLYQISLAAACAAALFLAFTHFREKPPKSGEALLRKFTVRPGVDLGVYAQVALAPDGKRIAFTARGAAEGVARGSLWVHRLDLQESKAIAGTAGAELPFWSPGSDLIAYSAGGALRRVAAVGGSEIQLCRLPCTRFQGGAWSLDGDLIVFGCDGTIYEIPARGGNPKPLISPSEIAESETATGNPNPTRGSATSGTHDFLPAAAGARVLLYVFRDTMFVQDLETGRREQLGLGIAPFYSPSGHIVYNTGFWTSELWALPFSLDTLKAAGKSFPIAQNARSASIASDGTLTYVDMSDAKLERMVWLNRQGEETEEIGAVEGAVTTPGFSLSPDGRRLAGASAEGPRHDLWIWDVDRGVRTHLTADPAIDVIPIWSPSGEELAFSSYRSGSFDIFMRRADGSGEEKALVTTAKDDWASDWSRDGKFMLYVTDGPDNKNDIWYLERDEQGGWEPHPFLRTPAHETVPKFSPDGRHVVYVSDDSGQPEIYIRPFPDGAYRQIVSDAGGIQPRWSRDGKEIFYVQRSAVVAVPVSTDPKISIGGAKRLFENPRLAGFPVAQYDVAPDGQRFVLPKLEGETSIRVVMNWYEEFRDRTN